MATVYLRNLPSIIATKFQGFYCSISTLIVFGLTCEYLHVRWTNSNLLQKWNLRVLFTLFELSFEFCYGPVGFAGVFHFPEFSSIIAEHL